MRRARAFARVHPWAGDCSHLSHAVYQQLRSPMKTQIRFLFTLLCAASATLLIGLALLTPANAAKPPPNIAWSPSTNGTFDYGMVNVGQTASQQFTLTNTGGSATGRLNISLMAPGSFAITSDACTGTALGPRKSCAVTVAFAPTMAGAENTTLTALGRKPPTGPANLNLTGTGVALVRHIYWSNVGTNTIGRADLDGSNVNQSFITGADDPADVAVDAEHIYWPNYNTNTIGRADLDGSNPNQNFITTGASNPLGMAVDAGHIY